MFEHVRGAYEIMKLLEKVEKSPAKALTSAAKAGAKIVQADAKSNAPVDTGKMKRGIRLKAERRKAGKKVYQIKFVGEFVKESENGNRSFYPMSQEYGWKLQNGKKTQAKKFMKNAIEHNRAVVEETIMNVLGAELRRMGG